MSDLTLAEAKKKARLAFKEAAELVRSGKMTPRNVSRELIDIYWGIYHRLGMKARVEFNEWYKAEHEKTGKKIGAK